MMIRIDRFFFDEKDVFLALFGVFILAFYLLGLDTAPFKKESLLVLYVFLAVTRTTVSQAKINVYMIAVFVGLLVSLVLSPYGVALYAALSFILITRTSLGR